MTAPARSGGGGRPATGPGPGWSTAKPWPASPRGRGRLPTQGRNPLPPLRPPSSDVWLDGVGLGGDGDLPSAGQRPGQDAWLWLRQPPALGLLGPVMSSAHRGEVTFTRLPALMARNRMI